MTPEEDLPDCVLIGRPISFMLQNALLLEEGFRAHRIRYKPVDEDLSDMTPDRPRAALRTYARRTIRGTVPTKTQKKEKMAQLR